MGVKMSCRYLGDKKTEVSHEPSGAKFLTSAPKDNQGDGSQFSPTDLAGASLLSCMITTMALGAEARGIDLGGTHGKIEKFMESSPRRLGRFEVVLHLPESLTKDQRKLLENIAKTCPVHHSLNPLVEIEIGFIYDIGP